MLPRGFQREMGKEAPMKSLVTAVVVLCIAIPGIAYESKIPANSKVYVAPMDGFETYVIAAIHAKNVPVQVVADKDKADYELSGTSDSQKPGWAKTIFLGQARTDEQASITLTNITTSEVVFAYTVNKQNALRGKQSAAESCAKHLKDFVEKPAKK
jgi:hypothetical protein